MKPLKIFRFVSEPRQTAFAPEWHYVLAESTIENVDFNKVAQLILNKEKEIVTAFPSASVSADAYTGLGADSLTSRYPYFNLLAWEDAEIEKIKSAVLETYIDFLTALNVPRRKVWIQCWANVLRDGQEIKPHIHSVTPYAYLGGHVCVQASNTSTVYINPINQINDPEVITSANAVGKITLFQNSIPHYTTPHKGSTERITIAFDIMVDELAQQRAGNNYLPFDL